MRAFLELVDCATDVRCSLRPGERVRIRAGRPLVVGSAAHDDVSVVSPRRRHALCAFADEGDQVVVSARAGGGVFVRDRPLGENPFDLIDGDVIDVRDDLRLRLVVVPDAAGFDTDVAVAGRWVVFDEGPRSARCVPVDDPGGPPRRLLGLSGPDPLRRWRRLLAAGGGATAVREQWDDGDRRLVAIDDVAGASLDELLAAAAAQGATLDAPFIAALLRPSLHTVASTRLEVFVDARSWRVTIDGAVVFDGFVQAALAGVGPFLHSRPPGQLLVDALVDAARRGAAIPGEVFVLRGPLEAPAPNPPAARAMTALERVRRWVDEQPPVSSSAWRGLLAGLFPARAEREQVLRERLALLDAATVARLPRR